MLSAVWLVHCWWGKCLQILLPVGKCFFCLYYGFIYSVSENSILSSWRLCVCVYVHLISEAPIWFRGFEANFALIVVVKLRDIYCYSISLRLFFLTLLSLLWMTGFQKCTVLEICELPRSEEREGPLRWN